MPQCKLTALLLLIWLGPSPQVASAQNPKCSQEAAPSLAKIRERWQWELFWGAGITSPPYAAGSRIHIALFWSSTQTGYCSLELGSCASYDARGSSLGQMAASSATSGQRDLAAATQAFLGAQALPPSVTQAPGTGNNPNAAVSPTFSNQDQQIRIPRNGSKAQTAGSPASGLRFCTVEETLPKPDPPAAVRMKIVPDDLPTVRSLLGRLAENIPPAARASTEFVVPFYAETDPALYVLVTTKGSPGSIIFLVHDSETGAWRIGGHFDKQTGQFQLDKLVPLVLSAEMTRIKPA
jgi:hypothetical protein